tara:strand:- start:1578 stop:7712 length:6135 start_codon:yes stop_codon:yes gene_type:complete
MAIAATQFNIFGSVTQKEISVGYISSIRGYVPSISLCEANDHEKEYPNTAFILKNRDKISYIGIDEVNKLVPDDIVPLDNTDVSCGSIDLDHKCSSTPEVYFYGGGGVGAFANPVVGTDGGLLTLDITNPGFGYQYPPKVEVKDECGIAKGAVVRVQVSDGDNCVETWKYYKDQMDESGPDICADTSIPYGRVWGVNGQDTGEWDPTKYTKYAADPLMDEVDKYLESLKNLSNPWWTTRQNLNKQNITSSKNGEVTTVGYAVSVTEWSDFLNLYGISPVPPSDEPGSAHGGETFDFEWDIEFPWGGEYVFRGLYAGAVGFGDLYIEDQKVASLGNKDGLTDPIKYEVGIATTKKVAFKLHNGATTKKAPIQPSREPIVRKAGGKFIKEGKNYFYKVSGNDLVDIDFDFAWDKSLGLPEEEKEKIETKKTVQFITSHQSPRDSTFEISELGIRSHKNGGKNKPKVFNTFAKQIEIGKEYQITVKCNASDDYGVKLRVNKDDQGRTRLQMEDYKDYNWKDFEVSITDGEFYDLVDGNTSNRTATCKFRIKKPVTPPTPKERPAISKLTIQTETEPLVFEVPKTDFQPGNDDGNKKNTITYNGLKVPGDKRYTTSRRLAFDDNSGNGFDENATFNIDYVTGGTAEFNQDCNSIDVQGTNVQVSLTYVWADNPRRSGKALESIRIGNTTWTQTNSSTGRETHVIVLSGGSSLADTLGKGGKDYQQKGIISKKGNFKNGRKYRVTFDRQSYTKVPSIGDTGATPETEDQKIDFFDRGVRIGNTLQIATPQNASFAARTAYQLSENESRIVYPADTTTTEQTIFNTLQYIDKADRRLWKSKNKRGLLAKYGVAPFDTALSLPNMPYAGDHTIVWTNITFPVSTNYDIHVHVDDDVRIQIGDQVDFFQDGFVGNNNKATGEVTHTFFIKAGTYTITATHSQIPGGKWPTTNPMALAIDVKASVAYRTVADPKSWNENPMAVALSIKAPTPPPPAAIVPPILSEGECPESPIWHTRMKPEGTPWYPVKFGYWDKWTNKYAISPIPPLNSPGTDGTGNSDGWEQTWIIDAPYEGDYTFKGTVDNFGKIFVNGNMVAERNDDPNLSFRDEEYKRSSLDVVVKPKNRDEPWPQETKFYMAEGKNTLTAKVQNFKNYETKKKYFSEKIFSTKDWQSAAPIKTNKNNKPAGIMFTKTGSKYYLTAYGNDRIDADLGFTWDVLEGAAPPTTPKSKTVQFLTSHRSPRDSTIDIKALTIKSHKNGGKNVPHVTNNFTREVEYDKEYQVTVKCNASDDYGVKLRVIKDAQGRELLQMEDYKDYNWKDCELTVTGGRFYDLVNGNTSNRTATCKFKVDSPAAKLNFSPPSVTKITVQTETNPLVFDVPKTDAQPPNTGGNTSNTISYTGLKRPGDKRYTSSRRLAFDDNSDNGFDENATFNIDSVTGGTAEFNSSGDSIDVQGTNVQVSLTYVWADSPSRSGKALQKIQIGNTTWTQTNSSTGRETHIITLSGGSNPADNLGEGGEQWKVSGTIKKTGTFKAGKTYEVTFVKGYGRRPDGSAIINIPNPTILESGWKTQAEKSIKPNPKMAFKNPWDYLQATSVYQMSSATAEQELLADTTRNGVTYKGPALFNYRSKIYGSFMNENGISPDYPKIGGAELVDYTWSNVHFPVTGEYEFTFQNDHSATLFLDGQQIGTNTFRGTDKTRQDIGAGRHSIDMTGEGTPKKITVNKGKHTLTVKPTVYTAETGGPIGFIDALFRKPSEDYYRGSSAFDANPSTFAIGIARLVEDVPEPGTPQSSAASGKSWYQNPIGLCGIIIPPPCKQIKCGKGRIKDPLVEDPGTGFDTPPPPTTRPEVVVDPGDDRPVEYNALIVPVRVVIDDPGINYKEPDLPGGDPGDTPVVDDPPGSGIALTATYTPHGGISKIDILDPGTGLTSTPRIIIPSDTGVNFRGHFILDVVRDPIDAPDPDKLLQVTDLVGLKQTGYIQGRAYYGSVYYENGIPYAGITASAGKAIQVYATLQESIDGVRTTPPSAIQRQGTDISSNDPRLNIPGTPDNLT